MSIRLAGSSSGYTELDAQASPNNNVIKMPASNGAAYQVLRNGATPGTTEFADKIVSGTAQASTSGTSIDFTGIPSWVKRVTVMFSGVSTNGTSLYQVQLGTTSGIETSGYVGSYIGIVSGATPGGGAYPGAGYVLPNAVTAAALHSGLFTLSKLDSNSNVWVASGHLSRDSAYYNLTSGSKTLSGALTQLRITTVNGTDTFDAGSINIMYE